MGIQVVRFTLETTYNAFPATPAPGSQLDIFLPASNAMTVLPMPQFWNIRDAGVSNRRVKMGVGRKSVGGTLQTYLFPSQAAFFLNLAASIGPGPCFRLPSFTVDRGIFLEDGTCTPALRRYTGCLAGATVMQADDSDQGCLVGLRMDILGSTARAITDADFPFPAASAYPLDDPYRFYDVAGHLTVNGARTKFKNLNLGINNTLKAFGGEDPDAQDVGWFGRDVNFAAQFKYVAVADRAAYEAATPLPVRVEFVQGAHSVTFDLGGNCRLSAVNDDLPIDDYFTQTLEMGSLIDSTSGTDLTITVA